MMFIQLPQTRNANLAIIVANHASLQQIPSPHKPVLNVLQPKYITELQL